MADAYLPCPDCEGDGRARPNEHGAYVGGDPENCSRCGGSGTSHDLTCPACSQRTPDHLMCPCAAPVCSDCHNREHPRNCPDCYGTGSTRVPMNGSGNSITGVTHTAAGFRIGITCPTCDGSGRINEETPA